MVRNRKVVIVEDERDVAQLLSFHLEREGFNPIIFGDGESFLAFAERNSCDLVILDLMLPNINGLEVLKILKERKDTAPIPVIILTAKGEEMDRVLGLELGADDYVVKPFSPRELVARVKAILRRSAKGEPSVISTDELRIDKKAKTVFVGNKEISLSPTEFRLLETLVANRGEVLSRKELLKLVWEGEEAVTERTVDVHIRNLRVKLGKMGKKIKTMRGWGYKLS